MKKSVITSNERTKYLLSFGFTYDDIIKMYEKSSTVANLTTKNIKRKISDLNAIGFTDKNIIKMSKVSPVILTLSVENIISKIKLFLELGFNKEETLSIILKYPQALTVSTDNIINKFNCIISLGFTKEEVIFMVKRYPPLLSLSIENINSKVQFYDSIGFHDVIIRKPLYLIMSVRLAYARYMFFRSHGVYINSVHPEKLFINNSQFKQMYSISNETLLEMYDYDKRQNKEMKLKED